MKQSIEHSRSSRVTVARGRAREMTRGEPHPEASSANGAHPATSSHAPVCNADRGRQAQQGSLLSVCDVNQGGQAEQNRGCMSLAIACLSVFLTGGVVFGMSALYPVLYSEGVLSGKCGATASAECVASPRAAKCCDAQMLSYTLMTSVALLPSDALIALYGELVDRVGPRKVYMAGQCCAWCGLALLSVNAHLESEILWHAAFFSMGAAGPGVFFSILFLGELYPKLGPVITALSAATFDGSAICFYLVNLVYFHLGWSLSTIALAWLALAICVAGLAVGHLPSWEWLQEAR